jgi:hypothetical protein
MNPTISMEVLFLINQTILPDGYLAENLHLISCPLQYSPTLTLLMSFFILVSTRFCLSLQLLKELLLSLKKIIYVNLEKSSIITNGLNEDNHAPGCIIIPSLLLVRDANGSSSDWMEQKPARDHTLSLRKPTQTRQFSGHPWVLFIVHF